MAASQVSRIPPAQAVCGRRVALIVETSTQFGRTLLAGIAHYVRAHEPWSIMFTDRAVNDQPPSWLNRWEGDGIITRVPSPEIRAAISGKNIPVVDLNEQTADLGIPQIANDHHAIGIVAAQHLQQRRFRNFGFVGHPGHPWSDQRERSFRLLVQQEGGTCAVYGGPKLGVRELREGVWNTEIDAIAKWLKGVPILIGIFASTDFRGLQVLLACRIAGIAVPEEAAVLGVGNDDLACVLSDPPLSSVVLDAWQMGHKAAALLDRMMAGEKVEPGYSLRIGPLEVASRRSTDGVAVNDPLVLRACIFIREHAMQAITVADVQQQLGISRTTLQDRFRRELGRSVHDVIVEAQLRRARELLAETELPLQEVASRCGFRHAEYLSEVMRKRIGTSPGRYRKQFSVPRSPWQH